MDLLVICTTLLDQHDCGVQGKFVLGVNCLQETKNVWDGSFHAYHLRLISVA